MAGPEVHASTYELLQDGTQTRAAVRRPRSVLTFLLSQPWTITTLGFGTVGSAACFGYTYWLSKQVFECPDWALGCSISKEVRLFSLHLNQVQGVISAVHSLALAMMVFPVYQLAETTIWPVLATRTFTLDHIDHYLATMRGSLTSAPFALANARGVGHAAVLVTVILLGALQLADSVVVGHAYSLGNVTTAFYSNHSSGGGVGFGFDQGGQYPGAVGQSISTYNSWAFELSLEPMPDYRQFLMDRANLTSVGDFSAKAVEAHTTINCSARAIQIVDTDTGDATFAVNTTELSYVYLRQQPVLTVWVDQATNTSNTSAVTTVMFAAINGSIEGGHQRGPVMGFDGISSLACDVDVSLADSTICTYTDKSLCKPSTVLSSLDTLHNGGAPWILSIYMAAGVSIFGSRIHDTQSCYLPHSNLRSSSLTNGSLAAQLPISFTTTATGQAFDFSQEMLKNFITVGAGAMSMSFMQSWQDMNVTLGSTLPMQRLITGRSWILLMPPSLVLGSVVIVANFSALLYRSANVQNVRLGSTSEVVISSQTKDISAVVHEARSSSLVSDRLLSRLGVRYGFVAEGYDGLARKENVLAFTSRKVEDLRVGAT